MPVVQPVLDDDDDDEREREREYSSFVTVIWSQLVLVSRMPRICRDLT